MKIPIRPAPPVPKNKKPKNHGNSAMDDLLSLGNDPFSINSSNKETSQFFKDKKKPPPRPPPPKSSMHTSYRQGLNLFLNKDGKRNKTAATAVVKPLPATPVALGSLIDLESPNSSPTFLKHDINSLSGSEGASLSGRVESGFEDDFDPFSNSTCSTPQDLSSFSSPDLSDAFSPTAKSMQRAQKSVVLPSIIRPTIIRPAGMKPGRPPGPRGNASAKRRQAPVISSAGLDRDWSPPMPTAPAPPPPPEAVNVLLNGPPVPERPQIPVDVEIENRTPHCVAEYDYPASHHDDLSFKEGDVITLVERINEEWLRGRLLGEEGMFPENYVRIVVPLEEAEIFSGPKGGVPVNMSVVALYPFTAQTWDDLTFSEGDEITVTHRINSDWLYGECCGRTGQFPQNYVQDISELLNSDYYQ